MAEFHTMAGNRKRSNQRNALVHWQSRTAAEKGRKVSRWLP